MIVRLLGGASIELAEGPVRGPATQRHRLALLALLARAAPRAVPRGRAMSLLWPDRDTRAARSLLNLAVHVLRGALGAQAIRSTHAGLELALDEGACDLVRLTGALAAGDLERAVGCWHGTFADGLQLPSAPEFERWLDAERAALSADYARALGVLVERARSAGDHATAARLGAARLSVDPYSSRAALALAEALADNGDSGAAGAVLHRHVGRLRDELEVDPPREVTELLARLRSANGASAPRAGEAAEPDEAAVVDLAKGRHFLARRDPESLRRAVRCFDRVRTTYPDHAPAFSGLADAWALIGFYDLLPSHEAFSRARAAAQRALALDPGYAGAHASAGYVLLYYHWNWHRAEGAFRRAIALDPTNAQAHQWLGNCLALLGRTEESRAMMRRSRLLAPEKAIAHAALGWAEYFSGDYEQAVELQRESLELEPAFPAAHLWLGQALVRARQWTEAVAILRRAAELFQQSAQAEATLARALAEAGDPEPARDLLGRLGDGSAGTTYAPPYEVAKLHAALGERERALTWLERARRERSHSVTFLRVDPDLALLRDDPRAAAIGRRVGLV